jgi:hypothetical protein
LFCAVRLDYSSLQTRALAGEHIVARDLVTGARL